MEKAASGGQVSASTGAAGSASPSPPLTAASSLPELNPHRRVPTTATNTADTCSHSSAMSHATEEKDSGRHRSRGGGDGAAGENEEEDVSGESYSSYYSSYDEDEEDEEGSEMLHSSHGGSPSPGSPPPQEDLLHFLSYTLEDAALKDHRLMTVEAFRQVLLLGTNQGAVAVVEVATGKLKNLLFNHREPISDVDCTVNELYVASSDKSGYVSVQSRRDLKDVWISQLGMPIESLALHPLYHKLDSCPMVCGGGTKVLLLTKGIMWNNSRRVKTLQEGRGRVYRVRWCRRSSVEIVAWLSDQEITLYDIKNESVVQRIAVPGDMPQNALFPPTLRWERPPVAAGDEGNMDGTTGPSAALLLCGWGDMVQEVRVSNGGSGGGGARGSSEPALGAAVRTSMDPPFQQRSSAAQRDAPSASSSSAQQPPAISAAASLTAFASRSPYNVEPLTPQPLRPGKTPFPYRVCGIAPFGPQRYVLLASIVDPSAIGAMKDLEVRVVERRTLADVYRGRMPVRFIHPLQLHLAFLDPPPPQSTAGRAGGVFAASSDPLAPSPLTQYFILSVDTLVKATPADVDDHVTFLLRTCQFESAYHYAALHLSQLRRYVLPQIGHQWLLHLFEQRQSDSGAILKIIELLPELVPQYNSQAWEQWVYRLDTCGESWRLVALLPGRSGASAVYHVGFDSPAGDPSLPAPAVPATLQVPIQRSYYDLVLLRCLRHDANLFYAALHKFESLFTVSVVLKAAEAAYREHCGSHAWWADTEENEEEKGGGSSHVADGSRTVSLPASPAAKQAKREALAEGASASAAAPVASMSRTARWSLAASYGFLLRCAGRFEEAMQTLMHLPASPRSDKELFGLIQSEQLFRKTLQMLPELLQRHEDGTLGLLMEHVAPLVPSSSQQQQHQRRQPPPPLHQVSSSQNLADVATPPVLSPRVNTPAPLQPSQYGSDEDPLNVEAVVERLEGSDRLQLLRYLGLLKELYPKRFVQTAKRHAQLVATLYIDYDRNSLLPFLRQMSMYVERIRELHALCHKNNFVEEEVFLLFRMGREEEALRILIEKMHDIHRALEFIISIPAKEEQAALFVRFVDYTVNYNASLPCRRKRHDDEDNEDEEDTYDAAVASGGIRYVLHQTQRGETYASIAHTYHVSEADVRKANRAFSRASCSGSSSPSPRKSSPRGVYSLADAACSNSSSSGATSRYESPQDSAPPTRCIVPLNLFGSLLNALADPEFSEHPALDVRLVLRKIPSDEPIPHAGASVAAIAHTMAEETSFLSTVSEVGEKDLMGYYAQLLKRRTAAIAMRPGAGQIAEAATAVTAAPSDLSGTSPSAHTGAQYTAGPAKASAAAGDVSPLVLVRRCAACHQLITQQVVVFGCQHLYHPGCVLQYVREGSSGGTHAASSGAVGDGVTAQPGSGVSSTNAAGTSDGTEDALRKLAVYCRVCRQHKGEQG